MDINQHQEFYCST